MFGTAQITQAFDAARLARALDTWREAASLVAARWRAFLDAEPESRRALEDVAPGQFFSHRIARGGLIVAELPGE